jgi:hypothetical protein
MKVVYVAGKYSAECEAEVKKNIARAEEVAQEIWKKGHVAICPHLNTAHWGGMLTHEQFIKGDLELIRRCDAVFMLAGWPASKGACQEREFAMSNGIDVFFTRAELFAWANKADEPGTPPFAEDIDTESQPDWKTQAADEGGSVLASVPDPNGAGIVTDLDTPAERYRGREAALKKLEALVGNFRQDPMSDDHNKLTPTRLASHEYNGFVTKDSGTRHVESTGAVRDTATGKGRFDLSPAGPLKRLAQLYERGAVKYGPNNWRRGINLPRYIDSAMRHINDFQDGKRDEDHLIAAAWNLFGYVWTEAEIAAGRLPGSLEEGRPA